MYSLTPHLSLYCLSHLTCLPLSCLLHLSCLLLYSHTPPACRCAVSYTSSVCRCTLSSHLVCLSQPRSGEQRTQKLKSHLVRTQSLNVLPLKPGVGQYIAIHATLTARNFFLAYFYPSGPFTCIFSKTSPDFVPFGRG